MFNKIAVIGSGVMGCGIAAQIANNNNEVLLYDLTKNGELIAKNSIDEMLSSKNSQFVTPSTSIRVIPKSIENDLNELKGADLVIEVIIENSDIKKDLYNKLSKILPKDAILASNTSTFMLKTLSDGVDNDIIKRMVITHFFNPPRIMRLLEYVKGNLDDASSKKLKKFLSKNLGKDVIECSDSPGFIANRFGCYLMELTLSESLKTNLSFEEIDRALSKYALFPKTGVFGLYDLIGIDVMNLISNSLKEALPKSDDFQNINNFEFMNKLISNGYLGRKSGKGFYKLEKNDNGIKSEYILDKNSLEYLPTSKQKFEDKTLGEFFKENSEISNLLRKIFYRFFEYVAIHSKNITSNVNDIDRAMKLGFGWKIGPFEMMSKFWEYSNKYEVISEFEKDKVNINPCALSKMKSSGEVISIKQHNDFEILNYKSKKVIFEIKTKTNILTHDVFHGLNDAIKIAEDKNSELIIYSDNKHFSAGGNLEYFYNCAKNEEYDKVESYIDLGQKTFTNLKHSKVPVVACARGAAVGGGCEMMLHCDFIIAHQEIQAGLVETSIGLIPGWGGIKEVILNSDNNVQEKIYLIINGFKSSSAKDFAEKFDIDNIISIPGIDDILEFALNNNFEKRKQQANLINIEEFSIDESKLTVLQLKILELIQGKLIGEFSEDNLLKIEKEIFLELIRTSETKSLLEKFS